MSVGKWVHLLLAGVLIISAGCSGLGADPVENRERQTVQSASTVAQATAQTQTPTPTIGEDSADTGNQSETSYQLELENVSAEEADAINQTVRSFYRQLPRNKTERLATTAAIANASCQMGEPIDPTTFSTASATKRQGYRLYHASETLNTHFNRNIDSGQFRRVIQGADRVGQYTPIVGSYNQYYEAACDFDADHPETVQRFYLASASLGVEIMFIQYGATYKASSKATRMASHTRVYRTVQTRFGDDALRLLMSETHWVVRNTLSRSNEFVVEQYNRHNLSRQGRFNESQLRNQSGIITNQTAALSNQAANVTNETLANTTVDEDISNATASALNNTTVDEQIENTTGDTVENVSINQTAEDLSRTNVTENETLREVLNESSAPEKVECVSEQGGRFSTLAVRITEILSDGKIEVPEVTQLPNETRLEIKSCLQSE